MEYATFRVEDYIYLLNGERQSQAVVWARIEIKVDLIYTELKLEF